MNFSPANTHILACQTPYDTITKDIHIQIFFFLRQYWQVRANISGLQKLSTISLSSLSTIFDLKDETKEHCPVVELYFFLFLLLLLCNSFCLSLSHYVTIENMVVWQTPTVTALEYRQTQDSPATFHILSRESMENLLSNGSLQHHQFFFVSEPHDSTKHKVFYIVN